MALAARDTLVLVTGATGYLASHVVKLLLNEGYRVRGTCRNVKDTLKLAPVRALANDERLEMVEADLLKSGAWKKVLDGCHYVLHVASPYPVVEDESIIKTAVDGTLNVLKAAAATPSVRKVVLTSSALAIIEGNSYENVFTEKIWANEESRNMTFYPRSKVLAEKAAWDFVGGISTGNRFAFTVICPGWICGPPLVNEQGGASVTLVRRLLEHDMPGLPKVQLPAVDVRDAARCHVEAMRRTSTDGQRIMAVSTPCPWFKDLACALNKEFSSQGYRIPTMEVPNFVICFMSHFANDAKQVVDHLGQELKMDNGKAVELLGMKFISPLESVVEMAYVMIEKGMAKKTSDYRGMPLKRSE